MRSKGRPLRVGFCVLAGLCFTAAAAVLVAYFVNRHTEESSRQWPTVAGVIGSCDVEIITYSDRRGPHECAVVHISYSYSVDGVPHTGRRIRLDGNRYEPPNGGRDAAASYTPGTRVLVYHEPGDPSFAILQPGLTPDTAHLGAFPLGAAVFGSIWLALAALSWRMENKRRRKAG